MKNKVFRPNLDDVERLSFGKGAKKQRGTGSRYVCHRLNNEERKLYERAKQAGYLTVRGTGYRKERKGSPVCNTYRQRCDALEELCIIIEKRTEQDTVVIDFSTLRVRDDNQFLSLLLENVLKNKYPDLYLNVKNNDANTVFQKPINWDAVRTKPIWGIDERAIALNCARDIAKLLVLDILKESSSFDEISDERIMERSQEHDIVANVTRDDDDDSIDLNDL
mmetsp:Transcript_6772/g.9885  ORF Transcript_6772/g.9885 Transcript_6772/m.9885 type:complete len:222 (+) Transcript_6772:66-731(+)